jgi:hypothetical protein
MKRRAKQTIPTPTIVGVDNFELACNGACELDVGAGKLVGLELLDPVIGIKVPLEDDLVPVGDGNEEVTLIVVLIIVEGAFENIYVNEYAAHPAFPALSMATNAVAGQFDIRQLAARFPIDCCTAGAQPQDGSLTLHPTASMAEDIHGCAHGG